MKNKLKQCASNRYCRVRSFVQISALLVIAAVVIIVLWTNGVIPA